MKIEKLNLSWRYPLTPMNNIKKLVLHHPAHLTWTAEQIHEYHKNSRGWNGAGYNYFVTKDGKIQELRGQNQGAHVSGHNENTLGISFQGDFEKEYMTAEQLNAGAWIIAELVKQHGLTLNDVVGHRDLANTACPGGNFPMGNMKQKALEYINPNVKKESVNDISGHWAETAIKNVKTLKLMNGFPDGTFKPNEPLTRAQMATALNNLVGWLGENE